MNPIIPRFLPSGILVAGLLLGGGGAVASQSPQPNLVVIMTDDLGYGDLGGVWGGAARTPHLDEMAREGMRFTDFHSSAPVCTPTRAALMTGRYPLRLGIEKAFNHPYGYRGWEDLGIAAAQNRGEITIATYLGGAGYATGIFGKWHLGKNVAANPVRHGFDEFRGLTCGCGDYFSKLTRYGEADWWHNDRLEHQDGYVTTVTADNAVRFIEKNAAKPFFLYVPYSAIHFPWQDPDDGGAMMRQLGVPVDRPGEVTKVGHHQSQDIPRVVQAMIEEIDDGVGRIIAAIRQQGIEGRTLVIFKSDNGGSTIYPYKGTPTRVSSNGPYRGEKKQVYEGGHRVPAIAWWPGKIAPGAVSHETAVTMDLVPTMLELAGVPLPAKDGPNALDGVSLVPLLLRQEKLAPRTLFWMSPPRNGVVTRAVRKGPWKLVGAELYNLAQDPSESRDLASQYPERVRDLRAEQEAWERSIRASKPFFSAAR